MKSYSDQLKTIMKQYTYHVMVCKCNSTAFNLNFIIFIIKLSCNGHSIMEGDKNDLLN